MLTACSTRVSSTRCTTAGVTAGTAACGSVMATGIERLVGEVAIGAVEAGDAGAIIGMIVTVRAAVMEIEIATATGAAETVAIKNAAIETAIGTRVRAVSAIA